MIYNMNSTKNKDFKTTMNNIIKKHKLINQSIREGKDIDPELTKNFISFPVNNMLDLKELETKLDKALDKETSESLKNWLNEKRQSKNHVFLIEEGWIDPMENHNADGYKPFGYLTSEEEAKIFCEKNGYWTPDDCWSINYHPNKQMWKFRYTKIEYIQNI